MPKTEIHLNITSTNRKVIKDTLINEFLKELPGTGKDELTSKYYYYVEKTANGTDIYLKRPARLNKGMDFEVHAKHIIFENENWETGNVRKSSMPSHSTILDDLETKKKENPEEYKKVSELIKRIYNCENVSDAEIRAINFTNGHPIEMILKITKWLFIEQDVTYWNWSGRHMFYSGIE